MERKGRTSGKPAGARGAAPRGLRLVGVDRVELIGQAVARHLVPGMRTRFHAFLKEAFTCGTTETAEFDLLAVESPPQFVSIEAQVASDRAECRLVAIDITERKFTEATRTRLEVLAATNRKLEMEILRREEVEQSLRVSERQQRSLLKKSQVLQKQSENRKFCGGQVPRRRMNTGTGLVSLCLEPCSGEDAADFVG